MAESGTPTVCVSVKGRFHAFDLARELNCRSMLGRLITSYPKFKAAEWGIPGARITSLLRHECISRVAGRLNLGRRLALQLAAGYDRNAAEYIPANTDLFTGWSSFSLASQRRAKALGAKTIIERGSAHIQVQDEILTRLYANLGLAWSGIDSGIIERELAEYAEADFIFVPSSFAQRSFAQKKVDPAKVIVVPYGADLALFRPKPKKHGKFRILHCGRISVEKGAHILLRAFAELSLPGAELWLVGALSPEMKPFLKKYSNEAVFVMGPFPQRSLPEYYSQASVFCLASFHEGLALVLLQALSCGLPIIATESSGAEDIVREGETGFIVPGDNCEALKLRLLSLYENPGLRDSMAANTTDMRDNGLGWGRYGDSIAGAYQSIFRGQVPQSGIFHTAAQSVVGRTGATGQAGRRQ